MNIFDSAIFDPYKLNISALRRIELVQTLPENAWIIEYFDFDWWRHWIGQNWTFTLYTSIIYAILIVVGSKWMENRQPYDLSRVELIWNLCFAIFNFIGAYRVWPELYEIWWRPDGIHRMFCVCEGHETKTAYWGFLNLWSRLVELGGTGFIILRKRPLLFLHPYHHVVVLIYAFYYYQAYEVTLRVLTEVNAIVHTILYSYFVLKGLGVKLPKKLPLFLIGLQLSEMFLGIYVNLYGLRVKNSGQRCDREYPGINAALTIYASLFILFAKLMIDFFGAKKGDKLEEAKTA